MRVAPQLSTNAVLEHDEGLKRRLEERTRLRWPDHVGRDTTTKSSRSVFALSEQRTRVAPGIHGVENPSAFEEVVWAQRRMEPAP